MYSLLLQGFDVAAKNQQFITCYCRVLVLLPKTSSLLLVIAGFWCYCQKPAVYYLLLQGFGVAAKSTQECRHTDPMTLVAFHQADVGEYIRSEEALL